VRVAHSRDEGQCARVYPTGPSRNTRPRAARGRGPGRGRPSQHHYIINAPTEPHARASGVRLRLRRPNGMGARSRPNGLLRDLFEYTIRPAARGYNSTIVSVMDALRSCFAFEFLAFRALRWCARGRTLFLVTHRVFSSGGGLLYHAYCSYSREADFPRYFFIIRIPGQRFIRQ
jgi:hypothetical protein